MDRAARLAHIRGDEELAVGWQGVADEIRADIETRGVTPDGVMTLRPTFPRPRGLYPEALAPEKIAEVPVIGQVLRRGA
jgi:GH15 family glucan-1,4-alpha-glucosidase